MADCRAKGITRHTVRVWLNGVEEDDCRASRPATIYLSLHIQWHIQERFRYCTRSNLRRFTVRYSILCINESNLRFC
jgi:hypothetical protein